MTLVECENWADVEALIAMLLPPAETISELHGVEISGGVSAATREWLERVAESAVLLGGSQNAATAT